MKNRYVRVLLAVALFMGMVLAPQSLTASVAANGASSGLLEATNVQRQQNGLAGLAYNYRLSAAAEAKAADMVAKDYWSHVSPTGTQPWYFIDQSGYDYDGAGENLAYGYSTMQDVVTGWMNSPDHRANILNGSYEEVGFGVATADNFQGQGAQTIVVAMYGNPAGSRATVPTALPQPAPTAPAAAPAVAGATLAAESPEPAAEGTPTASNPAPASPAAKSSNKAENLPTTEPQLSKQITYLGASQKTQSATPWLAFVLMAVGLSTPGFYFYRRHSVTNQTTFSPMSYLVY